MTNSVLGVAMKGGGAAPRVAPSAAAGVAPSKAAAGDAGAAEAAAAAPAAAPLAAPTGPLVLRLFAEIDASESSWQVEDSAVVFSVFKRKDAAWPSLVAPS